MAKPPPGRKLRKREVVFAVAMGAIAATGAGIVLSENYASEAPMVAMAAEAPEYNGEPFEELSVVGPQDVVVAVGGDAYSVRWEGPAQVLGQMELVVDDGRLTIQPKARFRRGFDWGRFESATFFVTVPRLEAVAVAGSGDISIDRIDGDRFSGTIAGSGGLAIAALEVDEVDFRIGGSGNVVAAGNARDTRVSIGGSGEVQAGGLRSANASVSIGGSGDVALTVEESARISIAGSGDVDIAGPARCSVTRFGGGEVRCNGTMID